MPFLTKVSASVRTSCSSAEALSTFLLSHGIMNIRIPYENYRRVTSLTPLHTLRPLQNGLLSHPESHPESMRTIWSTSIAILLPRIHFSSEGLFYAKLPRQQPFNADRSDSELIDGIRQ